MDLAEAVGDHPDGASLRVRAVPGARVTEVTGLHAGALRVRAALGVPGGTRSR